MNYRFINTSSAKVDIKEAVAHYKSISPELAKQFIFRIREAKSYIGKSPEGFLVRYDQVRTLLLKQFPYHLHYLIDDTKRVIVILAIIHAHKNPNDYSTRQT